MPRHMPIRIKETECCGRVGPHAPDCKNWGKDRVIEYEEEMVLLTAAALAAAKDALEGVLFNPHRECEQTEGRLTRLHVSAEDEAKARAALELLK